MYILYIYIYICIHDVCYMFRVRKRVMMIVVTATIVSTIVLVDNCYCYDLYSCISIVFHEWRTIISLGRLGFHGSHTSASSEIS